MCLLESAADDGMECMHARGCAGSLRAKLSSKSEPSHQAGATLLENFLVVSRKIEPTGYFRLLLFSFINKVLLEHSCAHLLQYCILLLPQQQSQVATAVTLSSKLEMLSSFIEKVFQSLLHANTSDM